MGAKSAEEVRGWEYDWLACDADGHAALFSTAGGSYAPEEFLRDTDAHEEAIKAILASPAWTTARFAPPEVRPDLENTWRLVAERGLFAFDGEFNGGPYTLVAAPEIPAQTAQLPAIVSDVLRRLELRHVRFAEDSVISAQTLMQQRQ